MRGKMLWIMSMLFTLSGFNVLTSGFTTQQLKMDPGTTAHFKLMTPHEAGWLFMLVGLFGVVCAIKKWYNAGYGGFLGLSVFWGLLYFESWALTGYWRSVWGATLYALVAAILWVSKNVVELELPTKKEKS